VDLLLGVPSAFEKVPADSTVPSLKLVFHFGPSVPPPGKLCDIIVQQPIAINFLLQEFSPFSRILLLTIPPPRVVF